MSGNTLGTDDIGTGSADVEDAGSTDATAHAEMVRAAREREKQVIAESPWFDGMWYSAQYPDVEAAGIDPVDHFVTYGWREHRNPSAYFQTTWYLANNPDVDEAELNPLLHFIEHGEAENRLANPEGVKPASPISESLLPLFAQTSSASAGAGADEDFSDQETSNLEFLSRTGTEATEPTQLEREDEAVVREREDIALLQSSPLFDAHWYSVHYPDSLGSGLDPERHYLYVGGFSNYDPGPRFRSAWYLANYNDVADIGLNPLIHFLRYGQEEGRKATPEDGITASALSPDDAAAAAQTAASASAPAIDVLKPTPNFVVVAMQGQTMGLVPHDWTASSPRPLQAMLAMVRLHDWDDRIAIDLRTSAKTMNRRETPPFAIWDFRTLAPFETVGASVTDGWYAGDFDLRLRIEPLAGIEFPSTHRLRFHQSNMTDMTLCGESLLRGEGPAFVDVKLLNPFKPLLITVTDEAGLLVDASLIPFPSLLRGGAHHAEVVAMGERAARWSDYFDLSDTMFRETINWNETTSSFSIARVDVDLCGATGSERIFDPLAREWLAEVFKLGVSAINADTVADRRARSSLTKGLLLRDQLAPAIVQAMTDRRLAGHTVLTIPHDALPTISAISSRRLTPIGLEPLLGGYLVASATTGKAILSVTLPTIPDMDGIQPNRPLPYARLVPKSVAKKPIADSARFAPWPLAIRFVKSVVNPAMILLPHAPDADTPPIAKTLSPTDRDAIKAVAIVSGNGGLVALEKLLPSLASQKNVEDLHVILAADGNAIEDSTKIERLLSALFPGRFTLLNCASLRPAAQINEAARAAHDNATHLLFIDTAMVLHDPRTIDTMLAIAAGDRVATVGCPHVRQIAVGDALTVSAGAYFPVRLSLHSNPGVVFEEPKTSAIMIHATMPVSANSLRFALVAASAWRKLGGLADATYPVACGDIEFGLRARGNGYIHLNTSAITVTGTAHRPSGLFLDVVATGYMPVQAWQDIAVSTALVRELR